MGLKLSSCSLLVHDQRLALEFYCGVLGFEPRGDARMKGAGRVSVGLPLQPGVEIVLQASIAVVGASTKDRAAMTDLITRGLLGSLMFVIDDCDAIFERIEASGAEVVQEPINQPFGVRDCVFLDPSGNMLRFVEHNGLI